MLRRPSRVLSEDEQLRLALEKSMSEETVRVQSSAGFLTKKSDQLKFLDGNFDIADISGDENENTRFEADNSQDFIDAIQKKSKMFFGFIDEALSIIPTDSLLIVSGENIAESSFLRKADFSGIFSRIFFSG